MLITDYILKNSIDSPNEEALIEVSYKKTNYSAINQDNVTDNLDEKKRKSITWKEFDEKTNQIANLILSRNIKKGDRVAILLMNSIEWLPIYMGILRAGAIAVPMNYRYTAEEIEYCAKLAGVKMLFFGYEFIERIGTVLEGLNDIENYFYVGDTEPDFAENLIDMWESLEKTNPHIEIKDDDPAAIYFSSGTTGFPKAIMHIHQSLVSVAVTEQQHHKQTKEDCFLCIPPLYHTGAKIHWLGSLITGSKAVILRGVSPKWIVQTVSEEKCSIVWLLVPWAQDILDAIQNGEIVLDQYCLDQWRLMHIGAQPVPPSLIERWLKIFPQHKYDTNYGLSESLGPGCVHLGIENVHKVGAIGVAGYGWETKIIDDNGNLVKQGQVGELCVKGPCLMTCYWNNPEDTEAVLKDGWLLTGDMAKQDEDGFIYLVDRKKDVIITGGENIYPVQIENFIRTNSQVKDVAVIGLPDMRLGEIVAAVVQLDPNSELTEREIEEFCKELPRYKRPRKIFLADVPRNPTGKIEKNVLREKYAIKK